jgi:hypothetical protein
MTPVGGTFSRLTSSISGDSSEAATAEHRATVNRFITDSKYFSYFGPDATGYRAPEEAARALTGLKTLTTDAIDSEYSVLYVSQGLVPFSAFLIIGLVVWLTVLRKGLGPLERAWVAAVAAAFMGLWSVALITQFRTIFWIALGVVGAIQATHSEADSNRRDLTARADVGVGPRGGRGAARTWL